MNDDDNEMRYVLDKIAKSGDPGHLGDDAPTLRPLCRECVRDLPADDNVLCAFCKVVTL